MPLKIRYLNCGKVECKQGCVDEAGNRTSARPHGPYFHWDFYIGSRRPPQRLLELFEAAERQVNEWRKGKGEGKDDTKGLD